MTLTRKEGDGRSVPEWGSYRGGKPGLSGLGCEGRGLAVHPWAGSLTPRQLTSSLSDARRVSLCLPGFLRGHSAGTQRRARHRSWAHPLVSDADLVRSSSVLRVVQSSLPGREGRAGCPESLSLEDHVPVTTSTSGQSRQRYV